MTETPHCRPWAAQWTASLVFLAALPWLSAAEAPDRPDSVPNPIQIEADVPVDARTATYDNMELLTQVILLIHKHYYQEKSFEEITEGALHGLLKGLDPHSDFLDAGAYKNMRDDTTGKFGGIGINIGMRNGLLTVIAPIEDTPAFRAGLQAGDRIIEIDGTNTIGVTLRKAVEQLRGPRGEAVSLTVRRDDEELPIKVEIVRAEIRVPSVKGARILDDGVGYIRIIRFAEPTAASLDAALEQLKNEGLNALVLDLRNNAGGLLTSAVDIADRFLDKGKVVVSTKGRSGVRGQIDYRAAGAPSTTVPLAILINGGSASASEIVAGALQDHQRAILVGDSTFGKGSVQSVIRLKSEGSSAVRLTTALYFTPNGRQIHEKGLDPDIPVYVAPREWQRVQMRRAHIEDPEMFPEEDKEAYAEVEDRALRRAVDLLQALKIVGASGSP